MLRGFVTDKLNLDLNLLDDLLEALRAMYKRGMLALGQRQVELIHNTLVADGGEQAQADIADTVFARRSCRHARPERKRVRSAG